MPTRLQLSTDRRDDGEPVLVAVGELDLSNVHLFAAAIQEAAPAGNGDVLHVDLSAIEYLDSGTINVLFEHADSIDLVVNPLLLPVLTISGLTDVVTVKPAPAI
ncbi:STAS domain-containing protein [Mycolicibacterium parafortuitum]|uniref:Sulfate transporter/antisigma-factor antagonist STAS [Micromonospora aurantiaca ATCC] n=1 Tax=Mycolicibacterium parafortuitum TaxID=39692 RepID=A0A375YIQ8_MYCPF|nr:STAS domain-containing protein [Mycolicibacterium parafortuitum]ORB32256.1 anti-anti-sigma factor [Mycolicibacterium parafortuitum]SRX80939.1 sulfate transporter/antisigma-factor antagonist STAS [Micromonospora aurantiaca ATCC] [Mycolicibacterium parafortuitum]